MSAYQIHKGVDLETNFLTIFDKASDSEDWHQAQKLYEKRLNKKVIVLLEGDQTAQLNQASQFLQNTVCEKDFVESCLWKGRSDDFVSYYKFYSDYLPYLLPKETVDKLKDGEKQALMQARLNEIYSPLNMSASSTLSSDPMGVLMHFFEALKDDSNIQQQDGLFLVKKDGKIFSLFTLDVNLEVAGVENLLKVSLDEAKKELSQSIPQVKSYFASGLLYLQSGASRSMQEANTLGAFSLVGAILLILLVFKSLTPIFAALLTIFFSFQAGALACLLFFSNIHVATLLLGVSLVGLITDFSIHYFSHSATQGLTDKSQVLKKVYKPFLLSTATSVVGYICFYFSEISILRQLSVFAVTCLVAAIFTLFSLYPMFGAKKLNGESLVRKWIKEFANKKTLFVHHSERKLRSLYVLLFLGLPLLLTVRFDDNVKKLQHLDEELKTQEIKVREITGVKSSGEFYLVRGSNPQQLIEKESAFKATIEKEQTLSALSSWSPAIEMQLLSFSEFESLKDTAKLLFQKMGVKSAESKVDGIYKGPYPSPLKFENWLDRFKDHPLKDQYLGLIGSFYFSTLPVRQDSAVKSFAPQEDIRLVSKAKDVSDLLGKVREKIMLTLVFLLISSFILLTVIFGKNMALPVFLPPCLGLLWSLLLCNWSVGHIDFFHILALVLVFFLAIDYSFFNYFASSEDRDSTDTGITVSVMTTLLSFGVLFFSQTPAVSHFGMSVGLGILISFLFTVKKRGANEA